MINNKKFKIILCSVASLGIAFSATNFYGVSSLNIEGKKKAKTELQKKSEELRKDILCRESANDFGKCICISGD